MKWCEKKIAEDCKEIRIFKIIVVNSKRVFLFKDTQIPFRRQKNFRFNLSDLESELREDLNKRMHLFNCFCWPPLICKLFSLATVNFKLLTFAELWGFLRMCIFYHCLHRSSFSGLTCCLLILQCDYLSRQVFDVVFAWSIFHRLHFIKRRWYLRKLVERREEISKHCLKKTAEDI